MCENQWHAAWLAKVEWRSIHKRTNHYQRKNHWRAKWLGLQNCENKGLLKGVKIRDSVKFFFL